MAKRTDKKKLGTDKVTIEVPAGSTVTVTAPGGQEMATDLFVVLDRSGSMSSCANDTRGGYDAYIKSLRGSNIRVTLVQFDSQGIDTVYESLPVAEVPPLVFEPRASTPLYDAIGDVLGRAERSPAARKLVVILTDGENNCSRRYTREQIKARIELLQGRGNYTFVYLGANQDAWFVSEGLGMLRGNTMQFATCDMHHTFATSLGGATRGYASANVAATAKFFAGDATETPDDPDKLPVT